MTDNTVIELKHIRAGFAEGEYRGVAFTVEKCRGKWRVRRGQDVGHPHGSQHEAVEWFVRQIDIEMTPLPPEAETFLRNLAASVAALKNRLDPKDASTLVRLEGLASDLESIETRLRQDIWYFQNRLQRLEAIAAPAPARITEAA